MTQDTLLEKFNEGFKSIVGRAPVFEKDFDGGIWEDMPESTTADEAFSVGVRRGQLVLQAE